MWSSHWFVSSIPENDRVNVAHNNTETLIYSYIIIHSLTSGKLRVPRVMPMSYYYKERIINIPQRNI